LLAYPHSKEKNLKVCKRTAKTRLCSFRKSQTMTSRKMDSRRGGTPKYRGEKDQNHPGEVAYPKEKKWEDRRP